MRPPANVGMGSSHTPLAGAVLMPDLEVPQRPKVLQLKLLEYCNGMSNRVSVFLVHVNSFGIAEVQG